MENKLGMVGMGRVVNGRVMFSTVDGQGFSAPVTKQVGFVANEEAAKEVMVEAPIIYKQEDIDVPEFMKARSQVLRKERNKVIHVDFGYQEEEEIVAVKSEVSLPEQAVEEMITAGKRFLRPIKNYFFGKDEE